jgi:lysophospholipase L1-like esterase
MGARLFLMLVAFTAGYAPSWWTPSAPFHPTAVQLADNAENTAITVVGAPGAFRSNDMGTVPLTVAAGVGSLTAYVASDFIGEAGALADPSIGVYVDGVYQQELTVSANGLTQFAVPVTIGAAHSVDLYNGYQQNTGTGVHGTYVYAVAGVGVSIRSVATPTSRLALYGDSISSGYGSTIVTRDSFFARMRVAFSGRCALEAWGGRRLADDAGDSGRAGLGSIANLAARLVALVAGATTRQIVLLIGVNDWGNGPYNAATFQTKYAALLDAIHSADPGASVFAMTFLISGSEPSVNSFSETKATWRAAIVNAAAGRAWVTVLTGPNFMTAGGLADGNLHPSTAGSAAIFDGSGAFAGSTNLRAALAF